MPIFIQKTYQEGNADFINAGKQRLKKDIYTYICVQILDRIPQTDKDSTYRNTNELSKIQ